jgi:hypothetical protein
VGKPGRRRPLGRPRRTWEDSIKVDIRDEEWWGWGGGGEARTRLI